MEFIATDERYWIKRTEAQILKLIDRDTRPSWDFIVLLAGRVLWLQTQKIRKGGKKQ
mgnify:CR=1 FL=1|jgi:hypothetical protein